VVAARRQTETCSGARRSRRRLPSRPERLLHLTNVTLPGELGNQQSIGIEHRSKGSSRLERAHPDEAVHHVARSEAAPAEVPKAITGM